MTPENAMQIIAHPSDFSEYSGAAFSHALAMALTTKSHLYLLHVGEPGTPGSWTSFPHVRELLASWELMDVHELPSQIEAKFGIRITKVEIQHQNPIGGLVQFMLSHRPDLIVLATHGREGLNRWLRDSLSEALARRTHIPTLFLGPKSQGFVDLATGKMRLERVLIPVAHQPSALSSLNVLTHLLAPLGVSPTAFEFLHVGHEPPEISAASGATCSGRVAVKEGPVVETILGAARDRLVHMIAMPTAGHNGFLDVLRGSTTEQVLRQAPCPLLAIRAVA
jgi:nucleotide-binding universal stress UspA family protein